jgi:acyl-CoA thioester hydrolase
MDRFEHTVDVRYSDLDTYGHVNNAVYGTYCEEARIAYIAEVLGITETGEFPAVVASLDIDFRSSVTEPSSVDVRVWVPKLGDSSLTMAYELEQNGRVVAEAETTVVAIDPATRETRPIPGEWREAVAEYEALED